MSLDYNLERIADYESACFVTRDTAPEANDHSWVEKDGKWCRMRCVTETLICATMIVNLGEITEHNAAEFFARISMHERLHGARRTKWDGEQRTDVFVTPEEVHAHIGLTTNVGNKTWLQQMKHCAGIFRRGAVKTAEQAFAALTAPAEQEVAT